MFDYTYIFGVMDLVLPLVVLSLIYLISNRYVLIHQVKRPEYRYFIPGLFYKIFFALALCFIYVFYYNGGDTIGYFEESTNLVRLSYKYPWKAIEIWLGGTSPENRSYFDSSTGFPSSYWWDPHAYFVVRFIAPLTFITGQSYLTTTILLAWICYFGIWKVYLVFTEAFPSQSKNLAIAILFVPSVAFWGSGILKDTITLSAIFWFTYGIYLLVSKKGKTILDPFYGLLYIIVGSILIMSLKPYLIYPLILGMAYIIMHQYTAQIKYKIIRWMFIPFVFLVVVGGSRVVLSQLSSSMGKFSVESALENAVIVHRDLKQDYYKGSSFDIGDFDASFTGIVSKFPEAVTAGLFRPFIWEARNVAMLISALENVFFTYIFLSLIVKVKFTRITYILSKEPLLIYSLIIGLFTAYMVGLTTSNFGSMVRYRIPGLPFFLSVLLVVKSYGKMLAKNKLQLTELGTHGGFADNKNPQRQEEQEVSLQ